MSLINKLIKVFSIAIYYQSYTIYNQLDPHLVIKTQMIRAPTDLELERR